SLRRQPSTTCAKPSLNERRARPEGRAGSRAGRWADRNHSGLSASRAGPSAGSDVRVRAGYTDADANTNHRPYRDADAHAGADALTGAAGGAAASGAAASTGTYR